MRLFHLVLAVSVCCGSTAVWAQDGRSPSDRLQAPAEDPLTVHPPAAGPTDSYYGGGGAACLDNCCQPTCCQPCCNPCVGEEAHWLQLGGWVRQSFTWNPDKPSNGFNGPLTFTDRANEYQMNQAWLYVGPDVDTEGFGIDIGGRVDVVYGTDARFTQAQGLDDNIISDANSRFYKMAIPQMYAEVGVGPLSVKMGHFFTIIGYEVVPAVDNFFVTQAYTMQYGEPFTHTGALANLDLGFGFSALGGFTRGWDNWEDSNDDLSFLGGLSWANEDLGTSAAFAITSGDEDPNGQNNRTMFSVVISQQVADDVLYVFQHDHGFEDDGATGAMGGAYDAEWYGINQYLFLTLTDTLSVGGGFEWFRDDDGVRVITPNQPAGGFAGNFYQTRAGVNFKPLDNVLLRTEGRWDWYSGADPMGQRPYDTGQDNSQFTWATDLILTY